MIMRKNSVIFRMIRDIDERIPSHKYIDNYTHIITWNKLTTNPHQPNPFITWFDPILQSTPLPFIFYVNSSHNSPLYNLDSHFPMYSFLKWKGELSQSNWLFPQIFQSLYFPIVSFDILKDSFFINSVRSLLLPVSRSSLPSLILCV